MASVAALAITFPGGLWVGSEAQNVSADICAARLVSQCCSCLPSTASTHSETWEYYVQHTHTHTHFFLFLYHFPHSLTSLSACLHQTTYCIYSMGTHTCTHTLVLHTSHSLSSPPPPHSRIVPLSVLPQPFSHAHVPLLFSSLQPENISKYCSFVMTLPLSFSLFFNLYLTKLLF